MPRPVYIIAADSYSEDRGTNILSVFHILERIEYLRQVIQDGVPLFPEPAEASDSGLHFNLLAVWMKLPDDNPELTYEYEMAVIHPDKTENIVTSGESQMFPSDDRPLQRMVVRFKRFAPKSAGIYRFESRVRVVGEETWQRQDFPLTVEELESPIAAITPTDQS